MESTAISEGMVTCTTIIRFKYKLNCFMHKKVI